MPTGNFIFDYFWGLAIGVTIFNAFYLKLRSQKIIAAQPELREGYDNLFKGYLTFMNVPWVVMGIGVLFGGVPGTSYFRPRDGIIFVLAFHTSIVILWMLAIWWLYFNGGAESLVKYPGVFNQDIKSPVLVKIYSGIALAGGILGMILMWSW